MTEYKVVRVDYGIPEQALKHCLDREATDSWELHSVQTVSNSALAVFVRLKRSSIRRDSLGQDVDEHGN